MKTIIASLCATALAVASAAAKPSAYDPLAVGKSEVRSETFEVRDGKRERMVPIRVYFHETKAPAPVILFSHGLGGSRDNNPYLGNHWAKRGYADLDHIGMSGHSFGAVTTQAVAGQSFGGVRITFTEKRIGAALMMSPSEPRRGDPAAAFGSIRIPCLLMTGTLDDSPIGDTTPESRLKVFPNLTNAPAWQVVFDKATHMCFGERDFAGKERKGTRYHKAILALSTAFWDAELRGDKAAKEWLIGEGARKVLAREDKWEMNGRAAGK